MFLTKGFELYICSSYGTYAITPGDAGKIDEAVESSIKGQVSQFLDIIVPRYHSREVRSGLAFEVIAERLGYSASYISTLRYKEATPAFNLWNQLKSISINPKLEMAHLDPDYDIIANNISLRVRQLFKILNRLLPRPLMFFVVGSRSRCSQVL